MAHFAEIRSSDNEVLRVVVISDEDVAANGGEPVSYTHLRAHET